MPRIEVDELPAQNGTREFRVSVDGQEYGVTCTQDYYQHLTGGKITPEQLVEKSFEFLLEREPASAILNRFDLTQIPNYFPEYESEISTA